MTLQNTNGRSVSPWLRRDQGPTYRETRTANVVNEQIIIHVPNGGLIGARIVKQIVGPAISVEIGQAHHVISWHNCWSGFAAGDYQLEQ